MSTTLRREHDLLGDVDVPADAYYGAHTARAMANFPITGVTLASQPHFVAALATVKQAAAVANRAVGQLPDRLADAIIAACEDIRGGALLDQFVVDLIQGGAGTSTNMNANEVIANRALELPRARPRAATRCCTRSSTSTTGRAPTTSTRPRSSSLSTCTSRPCSPRWPSCARRSPRRPTSSQDILKIGRTQLQDAVPMTLGQEFGAFAVTLGEDEQRLSEARLLLHEINLGGTAIGTALNAHPEYRDRAVAELRRLTGIDTLSRPRDLVEATSDVGVFVQLSGVLKRVAVKLSKTCNDLRLLSSGPRAGFNEINLPARQAGSSIMPGKVNPVIPEVVNQIAFEVIGNDVTVTLAAEGGQLQLNAFEPIIARALFASTEHLAAGARVLHDACVQGITANTDRLARTVAESIGLVTALSPLLGYEQATAIAQEAQRTGRGAIELVLDKGLLTRQQIDEMITPSALIGLHGTPT